MRSDVGLVKHLVQRGLFHVMRALRACGDLEELLGGAQVRGEGADLAGMDEVQIVEAFFDLERRLEAAAAAARLPKASSQVKPH